MAYAGLNGDNETNIGASKSISLTFYDSNKTEIAVNYEENPIEFYITRNVSDELTPFVEYNTSAILSLMRAANDWTLFYNVFNLTGANLSVHVQIKPKNVTQYLVFLKYGGLPQLNSRKIDFDVWQLFCENGSSL